MRLPPEHPLSDISQACPKCGSYEKEQGTFLTHDGFWSSFFNYSNTRFRYLTCSKCSYTEFYKATVSGVEKFFDFLGGGS